MIIPRIQKIKIIPYFVPGFLELFSIEEKQQKV